MNISGRVHVDNLTVNVSNCNRMFERVLKYLSEHVETTFDQLH